MNMHIGLTQQNEKLEFVGRADSQVVTNVVCFRSQPDPLGIVLRFGKLDFAEGSAPQTTPSFRTSAHAGVGISIEFQTAYRHTVSSSLPFSGVYPREVVLLFGRLPRQCALLYRNDRKFDGPPNSNLPRRWVDLISPAAHIRSFYIPHSALYIF